MCRSIKILRSSEHPATEQEINEAALQFVRKVTDTANLHAPTRRPSTRRYARSQ